MTLPRRPDDAQIARYMAEMGTAATARQQVAARNHWPCCGELNDGPHHAMCKHYVEAPAKPIDGQTALA